MNKSGPDTAGQIPKPGKDLWWRASGMACWSVLWVVLGVNSLIFYINAPESLMTSLVCVGGTLLSAPLVEDLGERLFRVDPAYGNTRRGSAP